jgi:predicted O-linked N-acetylglucosamine transferase (SPINDLY family)/glycosyltransferase involved in cell wall biosynthesis
MAKSSLPTLRNQVPAAAAQRMALQQARARTRRLPWEPNGWKDLGSLLRKAGDLDEAREALQKAADLAPEDAGAWILLGQIEASFGDDRLAQKHFQHALTLDKDATDAHQGMADLLFRSNDNEVALTYADRVLEHKPNDVPALSRKAQLLTRLRRFDQAAVICHKLIQQDPRNGSTHWNDLGNIKRDLGDLNEAEACYRKAASLTTSDPVPLSNRLTLLHYMPDQGAEDILQACKEWSARFAPAKAGKRPVPSDLSPGRPLRVGMYSDGFRQHPVGAMTTPALEQLVKLGIEIYAYTTSNVVDSVTRRLMKVARQWTPIATMTVEQLAQRVMDDRIDILIDLSGHNAGNRIRTMTLQPAPVQVKWVGGLINTTGVEAIDYLLSDAIESPPGSDHFYTEKLIRMPDDYICYMPPARVPDVGALPALRNGYVTFGCFNNPTKINEVLLAEWARLLDAVPASRLFLKGGSYESAEVCERIRGIFAGHGIAGDRIRLEGHSPHYELFDCYNQVDVALDPWPYSGGLTTCEAMLMGVPVVTLPGPTFAGRHSATHLVNAGMPELVAKDWDEYRQRVLELVGDLASLSTIRAHLRQILLQSPVCDAPRFARNLANALRAIWQRYCAAKRPAALAFTAEGQPWFEDEDAPMEVIQPDFDALPGTTQEGPDFHFGIQGKIVVLDHGGMLATAPAMQTLTSAGALTIVVIDPASRLHDAARLKADKLLHHHQAHVALGDGEPGVLYTCLDTELTGTLEPLVPAKQQPFMQQSASVLAKLPIATIRLDRIDGLDALDWLALNETHDNVKVLQGAEGLLPNVLIVHVRVLFIDVFNRQSELSELSRQLARYGFRLLRLENQRMGSLFSDPKLRKLYDDVQSQLLSCDAIFVPDDQRIKALDDNQRAKLALILHAAYRAPDLAHRVLQVTGEEPADAYLAAQPPKRQNQAGDRKATDMEEVQQAQPRPSMATSTPQECTSTPAAPPAAPSRTDVPSSEANSQATRLSPTGRQRPFVSVVVPSYNRAEDLRRCLYSILAVDCDRLEIIVSDNASPDHTQDVLAEFKDPRIKAFRQDKNVGAELNMAFIFEKASGEWVITLTDDDWLMPQAVSVIRESVRCNPDVGFILSPLRQINAGGGLVPDHLLIPLQGNPEQQHHFRSFPAGPESLRTLFWHGHVFSRWILRRDVIDLEGYKRQIGRHLYSPMWITSKALLNHPTIYTNTHVVTHRVFNKIHWEYPDDYMYGGVIDMIKELLSGQPDHLAKMLESTAGRALSQIPFVLGHGKDHLDRYVRAVMKFPEFTRIPTFSASLVKKLQAVGADESIVRIARNPPKAG